MVPRLAIASSRVMPMPLSRMVTVPALGSASILICSSVPSDSSAGSAIAAKRSRSLASEAFEMSSRRKISLWLYREWIISFNRSRTSAWKPNVCFSAGFSAVVSVRRTCSESPGLVPFLA